MFKYDLEYQVIMIQELNNPKFSKLSKYLETLIDTNWSAGLSGIVSHKGKTVYAQNFGHSDLSTNEKISFDTIFKIQSMTKPITSLAILILQEEGKLDIDDHVSKYIPKFANMRILSSYDKETGKCEYTDVTQPVTIKHLLTHTAGLTLGMLPSLVPIDILYAEGMNIYENTPEGFLKVFLKFPSGAKWVDTLTELPLAFEPGTRWWYAFGHEVAGHIIELISGKSLDIFFKEKIFDPLGMVDTGFELPSEKWHRVSKVYIRKEEKLNEVDDILLDYHKEKVDFLSGGAGLMSTVEDYMAFCKMLLNGGLHNGVQYISETAIHALMQNHLGDTDRLDIHFFNITNPNIRDIIRGHGFGLGGNYSISETLMKYGKGTYSWIGFFNTLFWIDTTNQVIAIFMNQLCPSNYDVMHPMDIVELSNLIYEVLN